MSFNMITKYATQPFESILNLIWMKCYVYIYCRQFGVQKLVSQIY